MGAQLVIDSSSISDADGLGSFSYQWYRNGNAISGATSNDYWLRSTDLGTATSVAISFTDGLGFNETRLSDPTPTIELAGSGAKPFGYLLTDTIGLRLFRDANSGQLSFGAPGELLQDINTSTGAIPDWFSTIERTLPASGGLPALRETVTREAVAIEASRTPANGLYTVAVRETRQQQGVAFSNLQERWLQYSVDANGIANTTPQRRFSSAIPLEPLLLQDLDGDGVIGVGDGPLKRLNSEASAIGLWQSGNGALLLQHGQAESLIPVLEPNGTAVRFDPTSAQPLAVAQLIDASYRVAVKQHTAATSANPAETGWALWTVSPEGILDRSRTLSSPSVVPWESLFGEDLNNDGSIGLDQDYLNGLLPVATDIAGIGLATDTDGLLHIVGATQVLPILDTKGNGVNFASETTGTPGTPPGQQLRNRPTAYAVTTTSNGYRLAVRSIVSRTGNQIELAWDLYDINTQGVLNRQSAERLSASQIKAAEPDFQQDLDGDGAINIDISSLNRIAADTHGVGAATDANANIYLLDGNQAIRVVDRWGEDPQLLAVSGSGTNRVVVRELKAAERDAGNGNYQIAIQTTVTQGASNSQKSWELFSVSAAGVVDLTSIERPRSIAPYESFYNQDLNGDGVTGIPLLTLTPSAATPRVLG